MLAFAVVKDASSDTAKAGDEIELELARPLVVDGETVLATGMKGVAKVTRVRRAGRSHCRDGRLNYVVNQVAFSDLSIAKSHVYGEYSDSVPERIDPKVFDKIHHDNVTNTLHAVAVAPFAVVLAVPYSLVLVAELLDHSDDCRGSGSEVDLPRGRLLAVMITRDHVVTY